MENDSKFKIRLVDNKGNPLPGLKVQNSMGWVGGQNAVSDNNGYVEFQLNNGYYGEFYVEHNNINLRLNLWVNEYTVVYDENSKSQRLNQKR